jgi:hypothetical protein
MWGGRQFIGGSCNKGTEIIMGQALIQNGLLGDKAIGQYFKQETAKAREEGRVLVESADSCSKYLSDPADRARLRQIADEIIDVLSTSR